MIKRRNCRSGQSLVEFALMLPILLLILVVLFDLGRAVYYYSVIHNAAREGARYGIILNDEETACTTPDTAGIEAAVHQRAIGLKVDDITVASACVNIYDANDVLISSKIRVDVSYTFEPVTPLASMFISEGTISLHSTSSMNVEG